MGRELSPAELRELLPAHALDAVADDERDQVEEWLARSPEARVELDQLREAAALLSYRGTESPPELWHRIEQALAEEPPPPLPLVRGRDHDLPRRGMWLRVAAAVAAASAAAAAVTALVLNDQMSRTDDRLAQVAASVERDDTRRAAAAAAADPEARVLHLTGNGSATVVTMPNGDSFLMAHRMQRLPRGRTYQLWMMTADPSRLVSAGVLGRSLDVVAFHAPPEARGYAVTDESAPGVLRSHRSPVLSGAY